MILEKLMNAYSSLDLRQKINEIIENLVNTSNNLDNTNSIVTMSISNSDWDVTTSEDSIAFYEYIVSVEASKVLAVYSSTEDGLEQVFPDEVKINKDGVLTLKSPAPFNGYILLTKK